MEQLFLCLAFWSGVSEAGESDLVLNLCVEKAVPHAEWRAQVIAEARRQGKATPEILERFSSGEWYRVEIDWVRHSFSDHFSFQEKIWYLTGEGKAPDPWDVIWVNRRVRGMGQALPGAIRKYPMSRAGGAP